LPTTPIASGQGAGRRRSSLNGEKTSMPAPGSSTTYPAPAAAGRSLAAVLPPLLAILLGLVIVGVAGFSHPDVIHNAAHDTRHSIAFPCH
jgi:cobalt transporter subunit CbtB